MSRCSTHVTGLLGTLAISLLVAGCGGGSSNAPGSGATVSAAASTQAASGQPTVTADDARLIASADGICRRFNAQLTGESRAQTSDIARTAPRNAAIESRAVGELSKLTPPASLASDWSQILAYRRTLAQELVVLAQDARAGNAAGMRALAASKKKVRNELSRLAARDGFKDCTSVGT